MSNIDKVMQHLDRQIEEEERGRCASTTGQRDLAWAIIRAGLEGKKGETFQCQLPTGHDGVHRHRYCPFPGFADETLTWEDEST